MVYCSAIVDETGPGSYRVTVTGLPPYDETRFYGIVAGSENAAAEGGLRQFIAEMEGEDHVIGAREPRQHPAP